jgi:hypothetical protein
MKRSASFIHMDLFLVRRVLYRARGLTAEVAGAGTVINRGTNAWIQDASDDENKTRAQFMRKDERSVAAH